jgi:hypothetical protein
MNHAISQNNHNHTAVASLAFGYLVAFGISAFRFFKPSFLTANPFLDVSDDTRW